MEEWLVVNTARFPHETIGDETILIDAETGHVLLLTGCASVLWSHLVVGTTSASLANDVETHFGSEAAAATRRFLHDLRAAEIIIPATDATQLAAVSPPWPRHFTVPLLERYDDIAKIIAMDPIHDVGPEGWPQPGGNLEA